MSSSHHLPCLGGRTHSTNLLLSALSSPFLPGPPTSSNDPRLSINWIGRCALCQKVRQKGGGIFCANFVYGRRHWRPCRKVWCRKCYQTAPTDSFPIQSLVDEDGIVVDDIDSPDRFQHSRNCDHFMTPFQCNLCQFRNVYQRNPITTNAQDVLALVAMRRAILDSLWSRESTTVARNLTKTRRGARLQNHFGFPALLLPLRPYPIRDLFGIAMACCMLQRSLDLGVNAPTIQFGTMQKLRSAFHNQFQAS